MSIQDDSFDLDAHFEKNTELKDSWERFQQWAFRMEAVLIECEDKLREQEIALKVIRSGRVYLGR